MLILIRNTQKIVLCHQVQQRELQDPRCVQQVPPAQERGSERRAQVRIIYLLESSIPDPWLFYTDPGPLDYGSGSCPFSSLTVKLQDPNKKSVYSYSFFSYFSDRGTNTCSVADPGCLSRILIFSFYPSRIQKQQQKRGMKKNLLSYLFFVATNFTKFKLFNFFSLLKKKIWASFQRIVELCTPKFVIMLSKIWVWDRGSGSRGQKGTGSRIRIRNTVYMYICLQR